MALYRLAICASLGAALLGGGCASIAPSQRVAQSAPAAPGAASAQRNKQRALDFYEAFFNQHDLSAATRYIAPGYIQHNPRVADGRDAFVAAFTKVFAATPHRHSTIYQTIAEGDLVALHVHTVTGAQDPGMAIVDLFRFDAAGMIVEHWDVMQPVPDKTASGHSMFD
ncbi:Predicted SnoaL-like aldol condensation-catalyzing enzyme [Pseudoxanthomonas sp. GM95]|uniref:nuclear transport factor 2 family protein n=1 Tax=Pseudoxanthomonas sp. GM95 TaxID=1881043 RepID=UPI0008BC1E91|nr:ester cyclase [Pseudoxanthomonas sp. GM95]SEL79290.1 Predicted SnoaL-like aldol condensation-catalyzing enzyme [Pseudoxanthomonas sp. GM95]